jgi:integrase
VRRAARHTYPSKGDADRALSLIDAEILRGSWLDPGVAYLTVGEYAERWLAERPGLSARTVELYCGLLRRHVFPGLGGLALRSVTPAQIRAWRQSLVDGGVGATTVAKAYRLVRSVFAQAVDDELIVRNPCRIKGAGVEHTAERPVLSLAEVMALADAIEERYRALVLVAVFGSLRWGELVGLRRGDVDLGAATVEVRRSVSEVGGRLVVKAPKTAAGVRVVALPRWLVPELAEHLERFAEPGASGRVFVGPKGVTPFRSNFAVVWARARRAAGLSSEVHLHDLRHTGNHLAALSGASTRELMARMGHASMRAALIYQHATADRDRAIADCLDGLLTGHVAGTTGPVNGVSVGDGAGRMAAGLG